MLLRIKVQGLNDREVSGRARASWTTSPVALADERGERCFSAFAVCCSCATSVRAAVFRPVDIVASAIGAEVEIGTAIRSWHAVTFAACRKRSTSARSYHQDLATFIAGSPFWRMKSTVRALAPAGRNSPATSFAVINRLMIGSRHERGSMEYRRRLMRERLRHEPHAILSRS